MILSIAEQMNVKGFVQDLNSDSLMVLRFDLLISRPKPSPLMPFYFPISLTRNVLFIKGSILNKKCLCSLSLDNRKSHISAHVYTIYY